MTSQAAKPPSIPADPPFVDRRVATRPRRETLDENKRSFLRMVSHELRTPLNAVIGFSEILACELYGPLGNAQYKEYAELVRQSGHKLLNLVNQILEIARLEGHVVDLDLRPESLDQAVEEVLGMLADEIAARRTVVVVEGQGALPSVCADGRGLRTMLFNLIQNAVHYSPEGSTVTVRARQDAGQAEIEIEDQGDGVDPADIPRLLRPFEQGENALTRSSHGAGLGLPIVALLTAAMEGTLRFRTGRGEGMTAVIGLPAA